MFHPKKKESSKWWIYGSWNEFLIHFQFGYFYFMETELVMYEQSNFFSPINFYYVENIGENV